jgi:hypothetical protein
MVNASPDNFIGLIGSNQVLYACGLILSCIKDRHSFQTDEAVLVIVG